MSDRISRVNLATNLSFSTIAYAKALAIVERDSIRNVCNLARPAVPAAADGGGRPSP